MNTVKIQAQQLSLSTYTANRTSHCQNSNKIVKTGNCLAYPGRNSQLTTLAVRLSKIMRCGNRSPQVKMWQRREEMPACAAKWRRNAHTASASFGFAQGRSARKEGRQITLEGAQNYTHKKCPFLLLGVIVFDISKVCTQTPMVFESARISQTRRDVEKKNARSITNGDFGDYITLTTPWT